MISVVGRFLEHSRIYAFGEGESLKLYLSSADFMTRNQDRRVEVGCPVESGELKKFLSGYLDLLLSDNTKAWRQDSDGAYHRLMPGDAPALTVQNWYLDHPVSFAPSVAPRRTLRSRLMKLWKR